MFVFAVIEEESGLRGYAARRKRCVDSTYSNFSLSRCGNRNSAKPKSRKMEQDENWSPKN